MKLRFSLYLDLVRFAAAMAVFLNHITYYPFTKGVIYEPLGSYGAVAVTVFFVLSGYVIGHVVANREGTAAPYFQSRVARLYSVVLIALPLTFLFDKIGMAINPSFYAIQEVLWKPESLSGYAASLAFLNEYQILHLNGISPGTNAPYWSLSFEATYYLVAGLVIFRTRSWSILVAILILALAGRTITALLPIWAFGYFLYAWRERLTLPRWAVDPCFLLSALLIIVLPRFGGVFPMTIFGLDFPWGRGPFPRNLFQDYVAAAAFGLHLIAARQLFDLPTTVRDTARVSIRWLGSLTFPMYCIHYPAICLLTAVSPWANTKFANLIFVSGCTMALIVIITPICDSLKKAIRSQLAAMSGRRSVA